MVNIFESGSGASIVLTRSKKTVLSIGIKIAGVGGIYCGERAQESHERGVVVYPWHESRTRQTRITK